MLSAPRECKEGPSGSLFDLLLGLTNGVLCASIQFPTPSPQSVPSTRWDRTPVWWLDYGSSL